MLKQKDFYLPSAGHRIYVKLLYPKTVPAPAVILTHGLRSFFPGFGDMFGKRLQSAGYIVVKFHFVGTGKSNGKFEHKTAEAMLRNYEDVLDFVAGLPVVKKIGVVGRSNAGSLAVIHGPDSRITAYVFLAPAAYYAKTMDKFINEGTVRGKFFYHRSFKRSHTKGPGRLPLSYVRELRHFERYIKKNSRKIKPVILFQSVNDEAVRIIEGHFDYWKKNLPRPRKFVLIKGSSHSYKGHKIYVIKESIKWFKRYLPI